MSNFNDFDENGREYHRTITQENEILHQEDERKFQEAKERLREENKRLQEEYERKMEEIQEMQRRIEEQESQARCMERLLQRIREGSARVLFFEREQPIQFWAIIQFDQNAHESECFVRIFKGSEIHDYVRQAANESVTNGSV